MKHLLSAGLGALAFVISAAPAVAAVDLDETRCTSVLQADGGCVFFGNDNVPADIETEYNPTGKAGAPISLTDIGKIDVPAGPLDQNGDPTDYDWSMDLVTSVGKLTSADGGKSGTWELFGGAIANFISVKASSEFNLIKLTTPASSGTWSTEGLCAGRNCRQPSLSHLQFFGEEGGVVPEPATWAMMIAGFGLVGAAMRRRKTVATVSA
jgi:hypothetical protein